MTPRSGPFVRWAWIEQGTPVLRQELSVLNCGVLETPRRSGQALPPMGLVSWTGPWCPFHYVLAVGCMWSASLYMHGCSSWEVGWTVVGLVSGLSAPGPLPLSLPTPALSCRPSSAATLVSGLGRGPSVCFPLGRLGQANPEHLH